MTIKWEEFDEKLKNIKCPHVLVFKFFNSILEMEDKYASIMLRYIIKNNLSIFIKNPFYLLAYQLPNFSYPDTIDTLLNFYSLLKERKKILENLRKWHFVYKNRRFWNKNIKDQIEDLNNLRTMVKAIFDASKGGTPFHLKIIGVIKTNINNEKNHAIESASERLSRIYKLLGYKIFLESDIEIIPKEDFIYLENEAMFKYIDSIYSKSIEILDMTINLFENFDMINLKLDNLLNPCFINIEEEITSVTDIDDIEDLKMLF